MRNGEMRKDDHLHITQAPEVGRIRQGERHEGRWLTVKTDETTQEDLVELIMGLALQDLKERDSKLAKQCLRLRRCQFVSLKQHWSIRCFVSGKRARLSLR